jgi:hypothetical protein
LRVEDHFLALRGGGTATLGGPGPGEISLDGSNQDIDDENYEKEAE